ncbi:MAG TPA: putative sulfate exporter family transporter, partial [Burkholderiales bacterium]|nr:putative sulfate exporter family transporter [Burkholderiales bacterium]
EPLARNPVLVAMLFGLLVGNSFACPEALQPGLNFTKRYLLRLAIVLVGIRITVQLLGNLGFVPIAIAAVELLTVLVAMHWVASRLFRLDRELALLLAVGSAVCGAAAILSVAAITRAREQHTGIAIALITLAGTVALLVYPVAFIGEWLPGLDDRQFGVFVGASIYELAQVYGASYAVSEGAVHTATLVKLSKVLMLVPLLVVLGSLHRRRAAEPGTSRVPFPWFIVAFVGVMLWNSMLTVRPELRRIVLDINQFLFLMVMVSLGVTTRLTKLKETGAAWRLMGVGIAGLMLSTLVAYGLVRAMSSASLDPPPSESAMLNNTGGRLFSSIGCAKCHVPSLRGHTGDVVLYSDLLLHDMGPALDDKIIQGSAAGPDWRTTPLVGLRLRERYLHDGRASTLRDAILAHGGEGEIVRDRFFNLSEPEQKSIYQFLDSL